MIVDRLSAVCYSLFAVRYFDMFMPMSMPS